MTLREFGRLLVCGLPVSVKHYHAFKDKLPYCVWFEYNDSRLPGGNSRGETMYFVQVDYFTADEYDPVVDRIRDILPANDIPYSYRCLTEDEGGIIHHVFDCSVY